MFAHAGCDSLEKAKWVIVGIPSELGSLSNIKNYVNGPEAVRDGSYRIFDSVFGKINIEEIFDYGDLELEDIKNLNELYKKIYEDIKKIYRKDKKYIFIGGDHSITYPILKLIKENYDFYLLFFDSHPDIHPDPYVNYQSFIYYLIKEKVLDPERIIMIGISNLSFEEKKLLNDLKIKYYTPFDLWKNVENISKEIRKILDGKNVYISIDMDVFEMGCGHWLEPFGIRPYHYFQIIGELNSNLVAFDLVELYGDEVCENLAAKIIVETIGLFNEK